MRILLAILLFFSVGASAQQVQTNNAPTRFPRMLKADSILIIPVGCDTPITSNPKWGTATDGAIFLKTCDTTLWVKMASSFVQINGAGSITGNDTTIFEVVLDSTGQPQRRVLFSAPGNKIGSDNSFLWDAANNKLVINNANVSIGGPTVKLYVNGRVVTGTLNADALQILPITTVSDTTAYKPAVVDNIGRFYKMNSWPGGGGSSIDTTSLSDRINLKADKSINLTAGDGLVGGGDLSANRSFRVDTSQVANKIWVTDRLATLGTVTSVATNTGSGITGGTITTSGTLAIDTFKISTRNWRDKLADSLGLIIATKGTGSVTSVATDNTLTGGTLPQAAH